MMDKEEAEVAEKEQKQAIAREKEKLESGKTVTDRLKYTKSGLKRPYQQLAQTLTYKGRTMDAVEGHQKFYEELMSHPKILNNDTEREVSDFVKTLDSKGWGMQFSFDDSECEWALQHTNSKGAPGYDGLTQPQIAGLLGHESLMRCLFNVWQITEQVPERIKISTITSLSKLHANKIPTLPSQFRPIGLLPIIFKAYERIFKKKLEEHEIEPQLHIGQGGYRVKRGCNEQLDALRTISDHCIAEGKPLYIASLDISKAYDRTWRDAIPYKLNKKFGVPLHICRMI